MSIAVLGGGHVGTACALALVANAHARGVTLLRRRADDVAATMTAIDSNNSNSSNNSSSNNSSNTSSTRAGFTLYRPYTLVKPAALQLDTYARANAAAFADVVVATPVQALVPRATDDDDDDEDDNNDDSRPVVSWLRHWSAASTDVHDGEAAETAAATATASSEDDGAVSSCNMFVVLTRGLSSDGQTPAELVQQQLQQQQPHDDNNDDVTSARLLHDDTTALHRRRRRGVVLVASGPLFPREWALASAATNTAAASAADTTTTRLRRYSGTALTFAVATRALRDDAGLRHVVEQRLQRLLHRESVTLLHERDAADVLGLVNACAPLCAFGAGLVSNCYASDGGRRDGGGGCSVTVAALAAYAQHACHATQQLINDVLRSQQHEQQQPRARDTPLPACVWSTLFLACTNHASREFVFGRQLDTHGRCTDGLRAVYGTPWSSTAADARGHRRRRRHASDDVVWCELQVAMDGMHALLRRHGVSSPFYAVLLDTFATIVRASVAGDGLVKQGYYDYHTQPPVSPLLQYVTRMDEATFAGDDAAYAAAARAFEAFAANASSSTTAHTRSGGGGEADGDGDDKKATTPPLQ